MKSVITIILSSCIAIGVAYADKSDLQLKLKRNFYTLRVGQFKDLQLYLSGKKVDDITKGSEGIEDWQEQGFVYQFRFTPEREGLFVLGPYTLDVSGKKITSNSQSIEVLPIWENKYGTFFRANTNSITLGQNLEFVIETWSTNKIDSSSMYSSLIQSDWFSISSQSSFYSPDTSTREPTFYYKSKTYLITPKKEGEFHITKSLIRNFPENIESPNITITVNK